MYASDRSPHRLNAVTPAIGGTACDGLAQPRLQPPQQSDRHNDELRTDTLDAASPLDHSIPRHWPQIANSTDRSLCIAQSSLPLPTQALAQFLPCSHQSLMNLRYRQSSDCSNLLSRAMHNWIHRIPRSHRRSPSHSICRSVHFVPYCGFAALCVSVLSLHHIGAVSTNTLEDVKILLGGGARSPNPSKAISERRANHPHRVHSPFTDIWRQWRGG